MKSKQIYASVILPTHDRDKTLSLAIESGLKQTVSDIEIIIALDGATEAVRQVAKEWKLRDPRIRTIDKPKSPFKSGTTREAALAEALSDRIFILQDDDLWFPNQIETLGPLLDNADMVTGPSFAANLNGDISYWPNIYSEKQYRNLCRKYDIKLFYEAHYGFRRSSYYRFGVNWSLQKSHYGHSRHIANVFLASTGARFASTLQPTSLSLNSPSRMKMTQTEKVMEMLNWSKKLSSDLNIRTQIDSANMLWHISILPSKLPVEKNESFESYLKRFGLLLTDIGQLTIESNPHEIFKLSESEQFRLRTLWKLLQKKPVAVQDATEILSPLIDSIEAHEPNLKATGDLLINAMGTEQALESVRYSRSRAVNDRQYAQFSALAAFMQFRAERYSQGTEEINEALSKKTDLDEYFLLLAGHLQRALHNYPAALTHYQQALTLAPEWQAPRVEIEATNRLICS